HEQAGADDPSTVAFGCAGLDTGAIVYFTQFCLTVVGAAQTGPAETTILEPMGFAWLNLDTARGMLDAGSPDVAGIQGQVDAAATHVQEASMLLDDAVAGATLLPTTAGAD